MTVVCFGEMLLRLTAPGHERLFQSSSLNTVFGGSEANTARSLARFGVATEYVSRLPEHAIGDAALRALREEGVGVTHLQRAAGRMGLYFVETGAGQRPSTVVYDRAASVFSGIDASTFEWDRILTGARWLHVTGITAALGDGPAAAALAAMTTAKRLGVTVSFDVNYRAMLWSAAAAAPVLQRLAAQADLLIASEDHFEPLLGITSSHANPAALARERFGASLVAVTRRDSRSASHNVVGARLWDCQRAVLHSAPEYDVHIVDRIGAGDAFAAGLIYGLTQGRSAEDALRFGVAAGALKHSIPGDMNRVSVAEVDRLVAGEGSGRVQR